MKRNIIAVGLLVCAVLRASDAYGQGATGVLPLLDSATVSGTTLTCWFGYTNSNPQAITVQLGGVNFFVPGPINKGQPTSFQPGVFRKVFSATMSTTTFSEMSWTLNTETARCNAADAVQLSPAPSVDPASVLLTVEDAGGTHRLLVTPEATLIDAPNGVTFYTNAERTNGVYLSAGSGSWSTLSDVNRKTDFSAESPDAALERVAQLPVYTWSYIGESRFWRWVQRSEFGRFCGSTLSDSVAPLSPRSPAP